MLPWLYYPMIKIWILIFTLFSNSLRQQDKSILRYSPRAKSRGLVLSHSFLDQDHPKSFITWSAIKIIHMCTFFFFVEVVPTSL